ncbi:precorrin-2 C20-methyltransferase /cobalt-factor II C20-methyltransferase [Halopolyspora algeriensis]|uniref:Precorrin-2 C20-methyltransferase /cobalt-factor II C20-methyltransferase n=1 Tax=Halopolyspora algeriensis TaxID=1500506 RepID=A0A368VF85_9ACTN|nr:precorrin-2 C(20)-methyltransferase [Halopolyspora algeriensis]RCW39796.1 precorrin-2 C20-methyltransferase /cobalt-factor II C20-methyltransferase [Halopolyspora algeriensis]TQM56451.1 precorrin-2 C20-methyltransferase /cobalt-factor II C20-methyltransferase [Halopolyspora algeriensis]
MRLVGLGVGPGDPEMLTLAGLREIREASTVFVPVLAAEEQGRAEAVVRAHLEPGDSRVQRLVFALSDPVAGSQERRRRHWDSAAEAVAGRLRAESGTVVFATLGDPALYSTFTYLAEGVRELLPQVEVVTVPGITAMQATASASGVALTEGTEPLTVVPVTRDVAALREALRSAGTVVAYKGGRRLGELRAAISDSGALERTVYAEHLGTPDARVLPLSELDMSDVDGEVVDAAPYLSTLVVLPPRGGRGEQL